MKTLRLSAVVVLVAVARPCSSLVVRSPPSASSSVSASFGVQDLVDAAGFKHDNTPTSTVVMPQPLDRRSAICGLLASASVMLLPAQPSHAVEGGREDDSSMFAPKFVQQYSDFTATPEGWSFRQVSPGKGDIVAALGDRVVFDWSGYTIGYFGRPFQAKGGPQGGAFDKDIDFERTILGSGKMVKGLECALVGTSAGQVLQIVVPFEKDLSYPPDDPNHVRVGPKPTTFSGQRALNFVLENPRIDRTLLFNAKVIRVDKPNASGGFTRG